MLRLRRVVLARLRDARGKPGVAALDDEGRNDLLAATTDALEPLLHDGAVRSEMAGYVVRATC